MNFLKLPLALLLTISIVATPGAGQQKRRTPDKPAAKPPAAPAPAPATFDTLLSAGSYKVYAEARGVGQLVRSSATTDVLDPILKLGGPPKEFTTVVNWLKTYADQLTSSRLLIAALPTFTDVPNMVAAIEFSSPEEATKFESKLNGIMPSILPPVTQSSAEPKKQVKLEIVTNDKPLANDKAIESIKPKAAPATVPGYSLQRSGSLLIVSDKPVQLKKLRPAGTKLLSEDPNFRVAYNRFASDPIFVYIDVKSVEKERNDRLKQYQEEEKKAEEARRAEAEKQKAEQPDTEKTPDTNSNFTITEEVKNITPGQPVPAPSPVEPSPEEAKEQARMETINEGFSAMQYAMIMGPSDWPDALGIGFSPDNESFDVRALMIDAEGDTSDPVPFFHGLRFGAPIAPESAAILPADSELVLTMSLDFQQIYTLVSTAPPGSALLAGPPEPEDASFLPNGTVTPVLSLESALKINVREELLPLLGSEVAVSLPMSDFNLFGTPPVPQTAAKDDAKDPKPAPRTPFVVISLRDKEGMRRLLPKILEGIAGKAAASVAQTERREDTELVSYGDLFAYAFVGNFLVLATDTATTRRVIDSYLKGETLVADLHYKNSTRWQPRMVQGQVYVSPALMEGYKTWSSNARISDEARAFITRVSGNAAQPITYALSNDGLGAFHEVHIPKSFIVLSAANTASMANPPETVKNERAAMSTLWQISSLQRQHKEKNPASYASLEELIATDMMKKEAMDATGYKFELRLTAEGFELSAVPAEYGKSGKLSFFMDQTGMIHGADHGGAAANATDPPVFY